MFAFVTIGTNDISKSSAFYDELLKTIDIIKVDQDERYIGYAKQENIVKYDFKLNETTLSTNPGFVEFYLMMPFDKKKATVGNGTMISFNAKTKKKVYEFHKKALEIGAINEGSPGPRHGEHYYGYIRDLDGNKICVFASD